MMIFLNPLKIGVYSYDFYDPIASDGDEQNDLEALTLRFVYSRDHPVESPSQIFTDQVRWRREFRISRTLSILTAEL